MNKWLLGTLGHHFIVLTLLGTRIFGAVGGLAVIYYVELTLEMPPGMRAHFRIACLVVVAFAIGLTILLALWETRHLRPVLKTALQGRAISEALGQAAMREAVTFASRHHRNEAWIIPITTGVPVLIVLKVVDNASSDVLINITLAVFMAVSLAIMSHFFAVEYFMAPVIRRLLDCGVTMPYKALPLGRLKLRFGLCFSLIIITTALMIGTLARQRAADIIQGRLNQNEALESLMAHCSYVTVAAVVIGILLSSVLTNSVLSRIGSLVVAMENVGRGNMSARLQPTGNDEVDTLVRQFNAMVEEIDKHHATVCDLNANLERKVLVRTAQLQEYVRQLHDARSQLVHAEKMKSLGQLVAGVAHELNNSINAVYNGIQPLRTKLNQVEPLVQKLLAARTIEDRDTCDQIQRSFARICQLANVTENGAARTARIVNDLKTFSHPGPEPMALFQLSEALEMSLTLLSNGTQSRVAIHRDYRELEPICGPRNQLSQVFLNILNNAQQAIRKKGAIYVSTRREGDFARVSIRDTGDGIPAEIQQRLFDPFFTTKEPGVGTGLGLSISYGIVKSLGGSIECVTSNGQGAEFVVRIPFSSRPRPSPEALSQLDTESTAVQPLEGLCI
ncbi:MAG: ATP-binding protein [Pirellulales bacterium]